MTWHTGQAHQGVGFSGPAAAVQMQQQQQRMPGVGMCVQMPAVGTPAQPQKLCCTQGSGGWLAWDRQVVISHTASYMHPFHL